MKERLTMFLPVRLEMKALFGSEEKIVTPYEMIELNGRIKYRVIDINGDVDDTVNSEAIIAVYDCQMSENAMEELIRLARLYAKEQAEQRKYQEIKQTLNELINESKNRLKNEIGILTTWEFREKLNRILNAKFGNDVIVRVCNADSDNAYVDISVEKYIAKYATPEKFRFLRREYDQSLYVDTRDAMYDDFLKKNAPSENDVLKKIAYDSYLGTTLSDKNTLYVHRAYKVKLPHGFTFKQIEELEKIF